MNSIFSVTLAGTACTYLSTRSSVAIAKQNGFVPRGAAIRKVEVDEEGPEARRARTNDLAVRGYRSASFA
jgi:hypothetical protein